MQLINLNLREYFTGQQDLTSFSDTLIQLIKDYVPDINFNDLTLEKLALLKSVNTSHEIS